jgi:hypothetical protein
VYTTGTLDLTTQQKLIRPGCSDGGVEEGDIGNKIDLSDEVKIVKVYLNNEFTYNVYVTLYGPATYILPAGGDGNTTYTIARGDYTYWYFACGTYHTGMFSAKDGRTLKLHDMACPVP